MAQERKTTAKNPLKAVPDQDNDTTPDARTDRPRNAVSEERIAQARQRQVTLIGKRIRELRRNRLTLSQLAELSQVSVGLLSRLENGIGNPSFASLNSIARALDVDVYTFFQSPDDSATLLRKGERVSLRILNTNVELELLGPTLAAAQRSGLVAVLIHLPRGHVDSKWTDGSATSRMQLDLVLEGSVAYQVDNEQYELATGDTILFDASRRHKRTNLSRTDQSTIFTISREIDFL